MKGIRTVIQSIHTTAERELVGQDDTSIDGEDAASYPPADWVADEVDLLAGVVLGPEADTAEQEGPLVGLRSVRVASGKLVIVPEHGSLKLKPLAQERKGLDFSLRLGPARVVGGKRGDLLNKPDIGARGNLLVSVDFLLLMTPFRERCSMSPHGHLAWVVDQLEVAGNRLKLLVRLALFDTDFEQRIRSAIAIGVGERDGGELLVRRVIRGGDVMRQQDSVSDSVAKSDKIVVLDMATHLLVISTGGENLPVVVGIIERITGNLLALAGNTAIVVAKRVAVCVAVKVGLGLLVFERNGVVVVDGDGVLEHDVVAERLLELGGHEVIARTGAS